MEVRVRNNSSWIVKAIPQQREGIQQLQIWNDLLQTQKFNMRSMYKVVRVCTKKLNLGICFMGTWLGQELLLLFSFLVMRN